MRIGVAPHLRVDKMTGQPSPVGAGPFNADHQVAKSLDLDVGQPVVGAVWHVAEPAVPLAQVGIGELLVAAGQPA